MTFLRNIFIEVFDFKFSLYLSNSGILSFTLNGIQLTNNYIDELNGIRIFYSASKIIFSTEFGLTIKWNGVHKVEILLCDYYSKFVCGLCGNADGFRNNDKSDRKNNNIDEGWTVQWKTSENSENVFEK